MVSRLVPHSRPPLPRLIFTQLFPCEQAQSSGVLIPTLATKRSHSQDKTQLTALGSSCNPRWRAGRGLKGLR